MRIKITVSYDGTDFVGWQRQKNGYSVQQSIEEAIFSLTGETVSVTGSGRTDAGVHAEGQVAHFDTESSVPPEKFYLALNPFLPDSVKILSSERVKDTFHSVRCAKKKTYCYSFYFSSVPLPLKERYATRTDSVDVEKMRDALSLFIGKHDFKAFSSVGSSVKTSEREIYDAKLIEENGFLRLYITGNGFLYNMVRIIAGTVLAVGQGSKTKDDIINAFVDGERNYAGKTLPAKGLTLKSAEYIEEDWLFER